MHHGNAGDLGLAVNLLQVDTDGMEEAKMVRSHGRTARICMTDPAQPQMVPDFLVGGQIREESEKFPVKRYGLLFKFQVRGVIANLHSYLERFSLDPRGIQVLDLDSSRHLLVQPRWSKHDMRPDLTDIFLCYFRLLGEINGETHLKAARDGHHLFPDPCERKIGDEIIVRRARINSHKIPSHSKHVIVGEERSLRQGRSSGGVKQ